MSAKALWRKSFAGGATAHWWIQRITAALLLPLSYWLLVLLNLVLHAPYQTTLAWLVAPGHALAIGGWLLVVFYHAALGLQVVLEDYVAQQPLQSWAIRAVYWVFTLLAVAALVALSKILLAR
jgi:succinate dehydrogenase / fumarate reductase membrane anchor subunit